LNKNEEIKQLLMKIKVFIFDLEGTILEMDADWEGMRIQIGDYFLKNYGIQLYFKPVLEKIEDAIKILSSKKSMAELNIIRNKAFEIIEKTHIEAAKKSNLFQNIQKLLEKLQLSSYRLAILTRSGKKATEILLEKNKIKDFFEIVITRDDVINSKPSPEGVYKIIKHFKFSTDNFCLVGDHPYDIKAGKEAKIHTIGVLSGISSKEELLKEKPDYILNDITEILDYF